MSRVEVVRTRKSDTGAGVADPAHGQHPSLMRWSGKIPSMCVVTVTASAHRRQADHSPTRHSRRETGQKAVVNRTGEVDAADHALLSLGVREVETAWSNEKRTDTAAIDHCPAPPLRYDCELTGMNVLAVVDEFPEPLQPVAEQGLAEANGCSRSRHRSHRPFG